MFDRDLAQGLARAYAAGAARGGDHGELRDADASAQGGGQRDPRVPGLEAVRRDAVVGEDPDDRVRERPARQQAERGRRDRQDQRLGGQQAADLPRRRAQGAQHGGLAPALSDGERERAGHHEQRDGSGDAAHHAEDGDQAFAVGGLRVAGVGVGAVAGVEHVDAGPHRSAQPRAQLARRRAGLGHDADRVDAPRRAGQRLRGARRRRTRPPGRDRGGPAVGQAGDAVGAVAPGRDDPDGLPDAHAEACVGHDVAGTGRARGRRSAGTGSARRCPSRGRAGARRQPCRRAVRGRPRRPRRRRRRRRRAPRRARRRRGRPPRRAVAAPGRPSTASASSPWPTVTRRISAQDHVGGGEAAGAGRAERTRHQHAGGVGQRDGEGDRDEGAGEGGAAGAQGLPGDAQHVRPPARSGARRPARPWARRARPRGARRP